jgi:hypothetical protein
MAKPCYLDDLFRTRLRVDFVLANENDMYMSSTEERCALQHCGMVTRQPSFRSDFLPVCRVRAFPRPYQPRLPPASLHLDCAR